MSVPQPLAVDAQTTFDPATRSLLVKVSGVGATFWRRGHAALMRDEGGYWGPRPVWADGARGEPVDGGWLRFKPADATYRELVGAPDLSAIVTVDQAAGRILGVRFRRRQP